MKYTLEDLEIMEELRTEGVSWREIAERFDGSETGIRSAYCRRHTGEKEPSPVVAKKAITEEEPKSVQKARIIAAEHRKLSQKLLAKEIVLDDVIDAVRDATRALNKPLKIKPIMTEHVTDKNLTVEILFSDCQIGKLIKGNEDEIYYDTEIAIRRIGYFAEVAIKEIKKKLELGYGVEKLVIALLGDIIESDAKHETSYHGVDTSTSEQITNSITGIFREFLAPLFSLGIPADVICIAGNHDWDRKGMSSTRAGRTMLTYPIYVALEQITIGHGMDHVKFIIPPGSYAHYEIYGHQTIYEHGYQLGSINPEGIAKLRHRRTDQTKKHIDYFRVGDKHQQFMLDNGKIIVNGAFFHDTRALEYSGQLGFSSTPGQYVLFHTQREDMRNSIYNVMQVQLGHIL